MHQRKLATKPRKHLTPDQQLQSGHYDRCQCGGVKAKVSPRCNVCKVQAGKTEVTEEIFYIEGEPCRYVPLTRDQMTIVSAHRFECLSVFNWYAFYNPCTRTFYAARKFKKKMIYMQRQIAGEKGKQVDHKNRNTLDNRDSNLRPCTPGQNRSNTVVRSKTESRFKGVYRIPRKRPWLAEITVKSKRIYLGCFIDPVEAARAYDTAAIKHFGEFACTNFSGHAHAGPASTSSTRL